MEETCRCAAVVDTGGGDSGAAVDRGGAASAGGGTGSRVGGGCSRSAVPEKKMIVKNCSAKQLKLICQDQV